jgi:integrase
VAVDPAEGILDSNPLAGVGPVKIDRKIVDSLTEDEVRQLIKACVGRNFIDRRDEAIIRLMAETGARAGEVVGLRVDDVDLKRGLVVITRGKGGKGRILPIGAQTGLRIDRYLRLRSSNLPLPRAASRTQGARANRWPRPFPPPPDGPHRVPVAGRRRQRTGVNGRGRLV